jgi:AraC-like DNA-binding protein
MAEEATETRQLGALICALENALARRASSVTSGDTDMYAAFELLSIGAPSGKSLIPWLTREFGLSERTLRRRFDAAFGYGPKTLDRILRFQRFLKLVRGFPMATAANLAAEAGYADQAYLVRESRRLAVKTPRTIAGLLSKQLA